MKIITITFDDIDVFGPSWVLVVDSTAVDETLKDIAKVNRDNTYKVEVRSPDLPSEAIKGIAEVVGEEETP